MRRQTRADSSNVLETRVLADYTADEIWHLHARHQLGDEGAQRVRPRFVSVLHGGGW